MPPPICPDAPTREPPRLYDRDFALAYVSQLGFVFANAATAHYARWVEWLGGSVREVGWVMGAGPVVGLVLRPWMGQLINKLGAKVTWALGYVIFAAGNVGNFLVVDLSWPVYVFRACHVLGAAFVFSSTLTYISIKAPPGRRTEAIGTMGTAGFLGMLSGPFFGDVVLGDVAHRARSDFLWFFGVTAGALVLPLVLLVLLRTPRGDRRMRAAGLRGFVRAAREHWPGTILVVNLVFGLSIAVPFGFLAAFIDDQGLALPGVSAIGLFFLGYGGWGILLRLALRTLPDRFGRRKVLLAGMTSMGAGMLSFLLVSRGEPYWLLLPGVVCGTGHALTFHTMSSLALESFPEAVRGTGSSLSLMVMDLGMIAGAPILGVIADSTGWDGLFIAVAACCLAAVLTYTAVSIPVWRARALARRAEVATPSPADPRAGDDLAATSSRR